MRSGDNIEKSLSMRVRHCHPNNKSYNLLSCLGHCSGRIYRHAHWGWAFCSAHVAPDSMCLFIHVIVDTDYGLLHNIPAVCGNMHGIASRAVKTIQISTFGTWNVYINKIDCISAT
jgi:hypothetical protein